MKILFIIITAGVDDVMTTQKKRVQTERNHSREGGKGRAEDTPTHDVLPVPE